MTKPARVASNGREAPGRILVLRDEPAHGAEAGRTERARLERPRGCREIEELLGPWLR